MPEDDWQLTHEEYAQLRRREPIGGMVEVEYQTAHFPKTGNRITFVPSANLVFYSYDGTHSPQVYHFQIWQDAWTFYRTQAYLLTQQEGKSNA